MWGTFLDAIPTTLAGADWKAVTEIATAIVATITFIQKVLTDKSANRLKRFEKHQELGTRYRTDPAIQAVLHRLYPDQYNKTEAIPPITPKDMFNFMGFYEEIAIMVTSGLMEPEVAYFTYGFDAMVFWQKFGPQQDGSSFIHDQSAWRLFINFTRQVERFWKTHPAGQNVDLSKIRY